MKRKKGRKPAFLVIAAVLLAVLTSVAVFRERLWHQYLFVTQFERLPDNASGYAEYRHKQTRIIFVRLSGGTFSMGSPEGRGEDRRAGEVEHEVRLSPFLISKYEVTKGQWKRVMGESFSPVKGDALPVNGVSWNDCREFCKRSGLRLPTEAQWEYACRAGSTGPYGGTGKLDEMGWHRANNFNRTHEVGGKKPNGFGLHDMHGNLSEWCQDVYDQDFYSKPEATQSDPVCTSGSALRVLRGGSWLDGAESCRSASRLRYMPAGRDVDFGFRPTWPAR